MMTVLKQTQYFAGILVCSQCAGVHREGVSRQIRSLAYDTSTWSKEENIVALEEGGNAKNHAMYVLACLFGMLWSSPAPRKMQARTCADSWGVHGT